MGPGHAGGLLLLTLATAGIITAVGCASETFSSAGPVVDGSADVVARPDSSIDGSFPDGGEPDANPTDGAVLLGSPLDYAIVDTLAMGSAEAFQFTATADGTALTFHIYVDATSMCPTLFMGVYSGSLTPQNLLALGKLGVAAPGGWNAFPATMMATIVKGTSYWLAVLCPNAAPGPLKFHDVSLGTGTGNSQAYGSTGLTSMPGTWSPGQVFPNQSPLAAYVSQ